VERVEKGRQAVDDPGSNPIQFVEGAPIAYWRDLAARNEFEFARRLPGPILLLRGADDTNVLAVDQQAWMQNLAGRSDVTERTFPGLTHYLAPELELALAAARVTSGRGARVSSKVIDEIARFVTTAARGP
jgi:alpha-beta hydrolase superfamily lysophospholipase